MLGLVLAPRSALMLRKFSKTTHRKQNSFMVMTRTAKWQSKSTMRVCPCRGRRTQYDQRYLSEWGWPALSYCKAREVPVFGMTKKIAWPRIWAKIVNVIESQTTQTKMTSTKTRSCRRSVLLKSRVMSSASPPNQAAILSMLEASFAALIKNLISNRQIIINGHF